jgi:hypothetical protein
VVWAVVLGQAVVVLSQAVLLVVYEHPVVINNSLRIFRDLVDNKLESKVVDLRNQVAMDNNFHSHKSVDQLCVPEVLVLEAGLKRPDLAELDLKQDDVSYWIFDQQVHYMQY